MRTIRLIMTAATTTVFLGGCSLPDVESMNRFDLSAFKPRSVGALRDERTREITPADLVDAGGACAAPAAEAAPADGQTPASPGGVALRMTECQVVQRAGAPDRIEIGANERSERTARITYLRGERPGVYGFVGGRLATVESVPQAAPAPRPTRQPPPRRTQG